MKPLPLLFMGSPPAAVITLKALIDAGHEVHAVLTQPDKPAGRGQHLTPPAVKTFALSKGLKIFQPTQLKDQHLLEQLRSYQAQAIIVVAYGRILPNEILRLTPWGAINVHFSLLPKYRGAACVASALRNGEEETGVTLMRIVRKLDAGPILKQKKIKIDPEETTGELEQRLALVGAELTLEVLEGLDQKTLTEREQDETQATYAPLLKKEEGKINWDQSAQAIYNHIRAMIPWPVAYTFIDNYRLKIYGVQFPLTPTLPLQGREVGRGESGQIITIHPSGIEVSCSQGTILITELQPESKRKMSAEEFLRGHQDLIQVGKKFI